MNFPQARIIDASAGSGKTHALTNRFILLILSRQIPYNDLTNILAITFTNNAAREMKQRILKTLKKLALNEECVEKRQICEEGNLKSEEVVKGARRAVEAIIERYSDFHVQTIDSFMRRILSASTLELDLPMDNEITESYGPLINSAISLLLNSVGEGATSYPHMLRGISLKEVKEFLDFLTQEAETFPWNPEDTIKREFESFLREEGKILEEIAFENKWSLIMEKFEEVYQIYEKVVENGLEDTIKDKMKEAIKNKDIKEYIKSFDKESLWFDKRKKGWEEASSDFKKSLLPIVEEMTELFSLSKYSHYGAIYQEFKKCLNKVKRRSGILHFDDINKKLSQYLQENGVVPEVFFRLGDRLYHYLLDEFQDTDRVQWENISPLLEEAYSKGGSLYAVGDMKQAVYMFRKADYRIMRETIEGIKSKNQEVLSPSVAENAKVITLEENYRSDGVILSYVDDIFKNKLKNKIGDKDIMKEDRTGLTTYNQAVLKGKKGDGYVKAIEVAADEYEVHEKGVLREILNDVRSRYPDNKVAILCRRNKEVEEIVGWLTEWEIPAASFSSLDIRKRKIIREIISLLQFLDSPIDNLKFAEFITGEIFMAAVKSSCLSSNVFVGVKNLERDAIFELIFHRVEEGRRGYLYIWFKKHHPDLWQDLFEDLFNKVGYLPLYELVSLIYRTFNVFENFPRESAFLIRFLESIGIVEGRGMNNIEDFLEIISEDGDESILEVFLPDYIDAVNVMTFHKAKGLGFPVVINMIYDGGQGRKDTRYYEKDGEKIMIYYIVKDFCDKSSKLDGLYSEKELDERIQDLNLLYVANTRAGKELYNVIILKRNPSRYLKELFVEFENGKKEKEEKGMPKETRGIIIPDRESFQFREKGDIWSIERLEETRRGEFFHEILSHITFEDEKDIEEIIKNVSAAKKEKYDKEKIKKAIIEFLSLEDVRKWFKKQPGRQIFREVEYVDEDGSMYRMDRLVIDPERINVIDFKTSEKFSLPDNDIPRQAYWKQVKKYMKLLEKLYPQKECKGYLAFIEAKRVEEVQ